MKTMQEIERRFMGDFTIESMMGNQVEINQMPCYSEDFNLRMMQEQYARWCIAVKKLFLTDMVEPNSMQGRFAGMMKRYMTDYARKELFPHIPELEQEVKWLDELVRSLVE